jgi:hypothetical protein
MSRVSVLGAGASKFAGYPLALDLWRFARDESGGEVMADKRHKEVVDAFDRIFRAIPPPEPDRPNLEETCTLLDLADLRVSPLSLKDIDWRRLRPMLVGMIAEAFQWYEYKLQVEVIEGRPARGLQGTYSFNLGLERSRVLAVVDRWTALLNEGDTIITFNWDLLHEAALWRAAKWHYNDGYGFACSDSSGDARSPIRMLKLHGSVNWAQQDERDLHPAIEHKKDFFRGAEDGVGIYTRGARNWNQGRWLITPTYLKDPSSNRLLLDLWNQASDALVHAHELTVIGYSLNRADAPARQLFASALVRNRHISEIRVVVPPGGEEHWDSLAFGIGKRRKPIRKTFEDWVLSDG